MARFLFAVWICIALSGSAAAGAWLREKGRGFLSLSATGYRIDGQVELEKALYAEWGAFDRLTMGLDINDKAGITGHALVFARHPIRDFGAYGRLAAEFGLGGHHWQNDWSAMYKATLSYGKEIKTGWGHGWIALDAAYERRMGSPEPAYKLDFTAGLSSERLFDPLLQIETTRIPGGPLYWTVRPSVMITGKENVTWLIGLERKSAIPGTIGLRFSLWRNF